MIQQQQLQRHLEIQHAELKQQLDRVKLDVEKSLRMINTNLNRILIQPPRQATRQQNVEIGSEETRNE